MSNFKTINGNNVNLDKSGFSKSVVGEASKTPSKNSITHKKKVSRMVSYAEWQRLRSDRESGTKSINSRSVNDNLSNYEELALVSAGVR